MVSIPGIIRLELASNVKKFDYKEKNENYIMIAIICIEFIQYNIVGISF